VYPELNEDNPIDDVLIEGAHPTTDLGYFIIKNEPKQHLSRIERGIPLHLFCKRVKRRKTHMEFRVIPLLPTHIFLLTLISLSF